MSGDRNVPSWATTERGTVSLLIHLISVPTYTEDEDGSNWLAAPDLSPLIVIVNAFAVGSAVVVVAFGRVVEVVAPPTPSLAAAVVVVSATVVVVAPRRSPLTWSLKLRSDLSPTLLLPPQPAVTST